MSDVSLVRCVGVGRTYGTGDAGVVALRDATCEVTGRDRIALVGPSGSGKSTLLHLMAALDEPTAGEITWPALGDRSSIRPGRVGVVFQGPSLIPPLTVSENVALPALLDGADHRTAADRAADALERLGLAELGAMLPDELSGGQAQRVAIARVLAGTPRLILADEPTGQLDRDTARLVVDVLDAAATEVDAALVVSTHDAGLAEQFATRWAIENGQLRAALPAVASNRRRA